MLCNRSLQRRDSNVFAYDIGRDVSERLEFGLTGRHV
jgi:hypothetical protein